MRTLIHISDLHFGRTEPDLEEALRQKIVERKPDLIIVSGDLTQRATRKQFLEAELFFASLPFPIFIVPGNHDVPLYSFWKRFSRPYANYRKYISNDLEPEYLDDEMAVVGINTVRILRMKEGSVDQLQTKRVHHMFRDLEPDVFRVVVSHHPFNIPKKHRKRPMARVKKFWKFFEDMRIDVFLSGHLHDTLVHHEEQSYKIDPNGSLIIQAGTAISTRRRKEGNAFNVVTLDFPTLRIERYMALFGASIFSLTKIETFNRTKRGWSRVKKEAKKEK
jgi:DNA repair exonuclease SbcCD nuclease subunit